MDTLNRDPRGTVSMTATRSSKPNNGHSRLHTAIIRNPRRRCRNRTACIVNQPYLETWHDVLKLSTSVWSLSLRLVRQGVQS